MFACGDAFQFVDPALDRHLWFVLSDPSLNPNQVLVVNLTSWRSWEDQACIVDPGEHPFVHHRSCVKYGGAQVLTLALLDRLESEKKLKRHEPASQQLLEKLQGAAGDSKHLAIDHYRILADQNLV